MIPPKSDEYIEHPNRKESRTDGRWIYGKYIPGAVVAAIEKPLLERIELLEGKLNKGGE